MYPHDTSVDNTEKESNDTNLNAASNANYLLNTKIYGDGIRETSGLGTGSSSWNGDYSGFFGLIRPFANRGGRFVDGSNTGLFAFNRTNGNSNYGLGFRSVLVAS